jgi:hypothetical protein
MGNLSISGREISLDSSNALEYKFMAAYQGLEYLVNAASGGMALSGEADVRIAEYIKFTIDNLKNLAQLGRRLNSVWMKRKEVEIDLEYMDFIIDEREKISERKSRSPIKPVWPSKPSEDGRSYGFLSDEEYTKEWWANVREYARTLIKIGKLPPNWNPVWDFFPEGNFRWDILPSGRKFPWPR